MPWEIQKQGSQFCVVKEGGKTVTCHPSKAKAEAHMRALYANEKAEFSMHTCEPCSRPFAEERSLFQHAAAVHGYDEAADRAAAPTRRSGYLLGEAPWEQGERRMVIETDRITGTRIIKEYDLLYKETAKLDTASHQQNSHTGSATSVSGLTCGSCERSFLTLRALNDHAEAVHDSALEATYNERQELVAQAIRAMLNPPAMPGCSPCRIYCYITDMTDEFVVYQVEGQECLVQSTYTISDDGDVTVGEAVKVRRRTVYEKLGSTS